MRLTEALDLSLQGSGVKAFDVAPGAADTPMTRSMEMWRGFEDWTPPERVVEIVAAIAAGQLDAWSAASCGPARATSRPSARSRRRTPPATCACRPTGTTTRSPEELSPRESVRLAVRWRPRACDAVTLRR
jgi:hypothetical protein